MRIIAILAAMFLAVSCADTSRKVTSFGGGEYSNERIEYVTQKEYVQEKADSMIIERLQRDTVYERIRVYQPAKVKMDTVAVVTHETVYERDTIYQQSTPVPSFGDRFKYAAIGFAVCIVLSFLLLTAFMR